MDAGPMTETQPSPETEDPPAGWGALDRLPGNPMMWILILSELLVFGAFFIAFSGARVAQPALFDASQARLDRLMGGINTMVLISSGYLAALAVQSRAEERTGRSRLLLGGAMAGGGLFLAVKLIEYGDKAAHGIGIDSNTFFTLFYLMTGFHSLHVVLGMVILGVVAWKNSLENLETGVAFWHMVDLVWIILYPLVYLIR